MSTPLCVLRNTLSKHLIETITAKTGNYKTFPVFCDMLNQALKGSDTLSLDLCVIANKSYLVLSYKSQFDWYAYAELVSIILYH